MKQKKLRRTFAGHQAWIRTIAFSRAGSLALTASGNSITTAQPDDDVSLRLWDVAEGPEVFCFQGHALASGAALSRDGRWIFSCSLDKTIRLWNVANRREVRRFDAAGPTAAAALSPDARYALSGHDPDGSVLLWRLPTD